MRCPKSQRIGGRLHLRDNPDNEPLGPLHQLALRAVAENGSHDRLRPKD